jgi:uncharacterized protein (DUF58 family)
MNAARPTPVTHDTTARDLVAQAERIAAKIISANFKLPASESLGATTPQRRPRDDQDFWQYRPYHPGDPARLIDWKKTARTDDVLIRERERHDQPVINIWIDNNPGMNFKDRRHNAIIIALILGLLAKRLDTHIHPIIGTTMRQGSAITQAQAYLDFSHLTFSEIPAQRLPRGSIILMTDGWNLTPEDIKALGMLRARHSIINLVQMIDPMERDLPYHGHVRFEDTANDTTIIPSVDAIRTAYQDKISQHIDGLRQACAQTGFEFYQIATDDDAGHVAVKLLQGLVHAHT